jgi:RND family efflux transporter MFP subunit
MDIRAGRSGSTLAARARDWRVNRRAVMIGAPLAVVALGCLAFLIMQATAPKPPKVAEAPLPIAVEIAVARARPTTLRVVTQGEVKAKTEADVAARVPGQIVFLSPRFEPGASFDEGEVLARIDPADYRLALDRSRSQVSRAREMLARAQADAELAEQDWKQSGLQGTPSDLTLGKPQVAAAQAELRTAGASVREAELNLQRTEIRAPFDGRVKERRADAGDFVTAGAPIATMFAVDVAQVRVALTDADLAVLGVAPGYVATAEEPGPEARLTAMSAGVAHQWRGELTLVEASIDPQTRLVYGLVEANDPFGQADAPLAPGTFVSVELLGRRQETLIGFPRSAFKKNEFVYVVADDMTIAARRIKPAMMTGEEVFVREGVMDGERVVQSYIPSPRDGMKIRDVDAPPPPPREDSAEKSARDGD